MPERLFVFNLLHHFDEHLLHLGKLILNSPSAGASWRLNYCPSSSLVAVPSALVSNFTLG